MSPWAEPVSIEGGWHVRCRLCGRPFARTFLGERTNYAQRREAAKVAARKTARSLGRRWR